MVVKTILKMSIAKGPFRRIEKLFDNAYVLYFGL